MMMVGWMTDQELINFKLELARAWIQNGHEDMARDLVRSIIERDGGKNE
jgi:Tfp pilus assembly protein FimV